MNMLTVQQETILEDIGFIASDESFLYAGFDDVVRGDLKDLKIESLSGKVIYCENGDDFVQQLLSTVKE